MNKEYGHWVKLAALCSTSVATLLLLVKIVAWWKTGAVSLLASVVDSLLDIAQLSSVLFSSPHRNWILSFFPLALLLGTHFLNSVEMEQLFQEYLLL